VDCYLMVVTLMVGLIEFGNPAGKRLTLFLRSHLRRNTPNMHYTIRQNYSFMGRKLIYCSSPVYTLGILNCLSRRSDKA
jgi:hypothetical protein